MKCPRCETSQLDEQEREGVVVDVCRQCRGIWLDRGELEKIIARETEELDKYGRRGNSGRHGDDGRKDEPDHLKHYREHSQSGKHYRKKSFFESIGDIFD